MPEYDDSFFSDCERNERKRWRSYNLNRKFRSSRLFSPKNSSSSYSPASRLNLSTSTLLSTSSSSSTITPTKRRSFYALLKDDESKLN